MHCRCALILLLLIPCSSQLAVIATFAAMVSFRVFAVYLLFCLVFSLMIYAMLNRLRPITSALTKATGASLRFSLFSAIKASCASVFSTAFPLVLGSIIISVLMYFGFVDLVTSVFAPFADQFLHLPPKAVSLYMLNVLKRDFGSSALLSLSGTAGGFDAIQMVVLMVMMTFTVPCFNSAVLLFKQEKLPAACFIWLGSFCISLFFAKIVSVVLLICFV